MDNERTDDAGRDGRTHLARDQILRREHGDREDNTPFQQTMSRVGNFIRLIVTLLLKLLAIVYIHTMIIHSAHLGALADLLLFY